MPQRQDLLGDFRGHLNASLSLGPDDFRDGVDEGIGLEYLVGGGIHDGFPAHIHIVGLTALAGPVGICIRVGSICAYTDDAGGFLIADTDKDKAVSAFSFFVLYNTPVEEVWRTVPVIGIRQDIFPFREVEIIEEAFQLVAGEEGIPV